MRTCNVGFGTSLYSPLARRGPSTIPFLAAADEQEPPWKCRLGHSEICASIKGGCDPRTDGRAQDRVPAPPWWPPQRRRAGRPVLRQPEGDGGEDRRRMECADRDRLRRAACVGNPGHHGG